MARKTILIVDDSDSICRGIASYLEVNGYQALTAFDGEQGVRIAKSARPDAILLDIMMPVLDGWEAIKQLKADPETAGIPVLALTALRISMDQVSAAGFEGYLSKPVPPHRLIDEITRVSVAVSLSPERRHASRTGRSRMKPEPLGQDETKTLEAELRQAMQLQRAAYEQMLEAQSALLEVTARARTLLEGAPVAPYGADREAGGSDLA